MIDLFNLNDTNLNNQIFYTDNSSTSNSWQTWTKPRGVSYVYITCIGGGGGGGSAPNVSGNAGGGGGGGSSSVTKILLPSNVIPDTLYIQVGTGGAGGTSSLDNAVGGSLSYVSVSPSTTASNVFVASGTAAASRGTRGTTGVGGTGGAGGTAFTSAVGILSELGIWQSIAGRTGGNGGYAAAGQSVSSVAGGTFMSGGAGGGGTSTGGGDFAGGAVLAVGGIITFNISGGATPGGDGRRGYQTIMPDRLKDTSRKFPMLFTGGSGGAGSGTFGVGGGFGGNGTIGCGGGGAGSQDGVTSELRQGGRGGNGLVLITSF